MQGLPGSLFPFGTRRGRGPHSSETRPVFAAVPHRTHLGLPREPGSQLGDAGGFERLVVDEHRAGVAARVDQRMRAGTRRVAAAEVEKPPVEIADMAWLIESNTLMPAHQNARLPRMVIPT